MPNDRSRPGEGAPPALSERLSVRIPVAMEMTGISRTKLYQLIRTGQLPIIKVGTATLIPVEALREFIASKQR